MRTVSVVLMKVSCYEALASLFFAVNGCCGNEMRSSFVDYCCVAAVKSKGMVRMQLWGLL
jgi:hypothetical protein